jgi:ligand-binding SRPBCC domain-containing protein
MTPFTLQDSTLIHAPIARCFALSTSIAIVQKELGMNPAPSGPAARTSGHVAAGDTVRWEGMQLGFPNYHVSLIPAEDFRAPYFFRDRMIAGRFRTFEHDHAFTETPAGTRLDDTLRFTMPFGPVGRLVGRLILVPHIRKLLRRRFHLLKTLAEGEGWRDYISA